MNESADHKADSVLVTGATGFVGSAIANAARAAGYTARVLAAAPTPPTKLSPAHQTTRGALCDPASLGPALTGLVYLVHTSADYRLWSPAPGEIMRSNLEGTRNVMD